MASYKGRISRVRANAKARVARCIAGQFRQRRRSTPEMLRETARIYSNKQKAGNIQYSIAHRLKNRILTGLRQRRLKKNASTAELLGCSWKEFLTHIEKNFSPGMSWDNRHLWELDHQHPLAAFDLSATDGQKAAFHYLNTRPLWTLQNRKKGKMLI